MREKTCGLATHKVRKETVNRKHLFEHMTKNSDSIILIPARMASTRLPNKPLADIHGHPMIVHVLRRAMESQAGRVIVAAAEEAIAEAVIAAGGEAHLTPADLPSGTDRIAHVLDKIDPEKQFQRIINVQGDLPLLEPRLITTALETLETADMSTLVAHITKPDEINNPNVVKAALSFDHANADRGRALFFSRAAIPSGGPHYHHIGLYVYRRAALERFVSLPPSPLEQSERLEQLRALEDGFVIRAAIVDTVPHGVDTPEDLEFARRALAE